MILAKISLFEIILLVVIGILMIVYGAIWIKKTIDKRKGKTKKKEDDD